MMSRVDLSAILADLPARISDVFRPQAEQTPNHPALVENGAVWTYGELASVVAQTSLWLRAKEVRPGDRLVVIGENSRALVALLLAAADLGAWPVLVNARLSEPEIAQIIDHSGARRVIVAGARPAQRQLIDQLHATVISEIPMLGAVALGPLNGLTMAESEADDLPQNRVAALIYTSGTTGQPKGVLLSHRNLLFIARVSGLIRSLKPSDRLFGVLPITHSVGLSVLVLGTLMHGATLCLTPRFNPAEAIGAVERGDITVMLGVPAMFAMMQEYAALKGITRVNRSVLRIISTSGAPLDPAVKAAAEGLFGLPLNNGYGITECGPTIAQTRVEQPREDCSVGPLLPGVEGRLHSLDGRPVAENEVGELWVRGPNIMKGYYRAAEETRAVLDADGWFNTRDLARFDDGNLFIVGRSKELIIRFGFNVYPPEVEGVFNTHPAVTQSAVIGRPHQGSEEVIAVIQTVPGSTVTVGELEAFANPRLTPYKRPSRIFLVPSLPVGPTGKVLKHRLIPMIEALNSGGHEAV